MTHSQIILASSSQTRKELMDRLRIDYQSIVPDIDESPRGENHADHLAKRLAFEKASAVSKQHPDAIVIGSDQVAWREGAPDIFMGKPLTVEKAVKQLQANSDKIVYFSTALSVQQLSTGFEQTLVEHYKVNSANWAWPKFNAISKWNSRSCVPAVLNVKAWVLACLNK